jgi:hypothetical protein
MPNYNLPLDEDGAQMKLVVRSTPNGPRVTELKITCPSKHPTGITTAMLRSINASALSRTPPPKFQTQLENFLSSMPPVKWVPGSRNNLSVEQLKTIASIYGFALKAGVGPTKVVEEWLGCSKPTASRAIKKARDLGFLADPARKGLPAKSRSKDRS